MKDECLICGAPLVYLDHDEMMECALCHKKEPSKCRCEKGHYVCSECHTKGIDSIFSICLAEISSDPIAILNRLMALPFCHMHGPEHHILVGASLLTAYKNAGGKLDLERALLEMQSRGRQVPGGACGFWGACGAGVSTGMFVSIVTGSTPLAGKEWGLSNRMTAAALNKIGEIGGPRCCKRDSYTALLAAVDFAEVELGVRMTPSRPLCTYSAKNNQCLGVKCPYSEAHAERMKTLHKGSFKNRKALENSERCGCFYCKRIYSPNEIERWLSEGDGTALCPHCGIDSVIAENEEVILDETLLDAMHRYWFCAWNHSAQI